MGGFIEPGMGIVLALQSLGQWLEGPMLFLSFLGTEPFFILVMPLVYWCIDAGWGLRIGTALTLSHSLNSIFKLTIQGPRPYWVDERVIPLSAETTFGAPSGHAQIAAATWGMVAAGAPRRWAKWTAAGLALLIGVSRIYLGMHFPHDVALGWLLGAVILLAILGAERALKPWLVRSRPPVLILAALGLSLGIILLHWTLRTSLQGWTLPAGWVELAARAPNAEPLDPLAIGGVVSSAAVFFGLAAGAALLRQRGGFATAGPPHLLALRYVLGVAGLLAIFIGLDQVFPEGETLIPMLFRYVRYALMGLWAAYLAPELFIRLRLAERPKPARLAPRS